MLNRLLFTEWSVLLCNYVLLSHCHATKISYNKEKKKKNQAFDKILVRLLSIFLEFFHFQKSMFVKKIFHIDPPSAQIISPHQMRILSSQLLTPWDTSDVTQTVLGSDSLTAILFISHNSEI